jgi:hypothetical protein
MGGIAANIPLMGQAPQLNDPLAEYQKGLQIKSLIGQQAMQQQQMQAAQTEQQQRELALGQQQQDAADRDAFNKSFKDANGNWDEAIKNAPTNGMSGQGVLKYQLARTDQVSKMATMQKDLLANEAAKSDQYAKDAYQVQQTQDPDARASLWTSLRNGHIAAGTAKPGEIPEQVPDDQTLQGIISSHKASADMAKEAIALQQEKAKLPGDQAEATAKGYSTAAQTMGGAQDQLSWTARRNLAVSNNPQIASLIPEQYSPQAAEQVRQLGIAPKDLATMAPDKMELQDFLKHPQPGYPATPIGYAKWKSDQTAQAQVRAVQMLTNSGGGGGSTPAKVPVTPAAGGGATPATPDAAANAPGGWVASDGRTLNSVNPVVRDQLRQILEYKRPDPPPGARGPIPQALATLIPQFDPNHDATTFPQRNKTLNEFQQDASSGQLGSIVTALGHVNELSKALELVNHNDLPLLHSIQSKFGLAIGDDAASTYKLIQGKVAPELASAYLKGGGGVGERGADAADFDLSKGYTQLKSNMAEAAQLLNSKLDSKRQAWDNGFKPSRPQDQFDTRFLTPAAKDTLQSLSSQAPTNRSNGAAPGKIRARDPQGVLHEAPAGTPLPQGWKPE